MDFDNRSSDHTDQNIIEEVC